MKICLDRLRQSNNRTLIDSQTTLDFILLLPLSLPMNKRQGEMTEAL
jgi:hypothetical protein